MLQKIADFYEEEVDAATKDMLAMLEPIIIAVLGVSVGGIVISLYMPLFAMIAKLAGSESRTLGRPDLLRRRPASGYRGTVLGLRCKVLGRRILMPGYLTPASCRGRGSGSSRRR